MQEAADGGGGGDGKPALERWSELLVDAARARWRKKRAVFEEDFAEAGRLKRHESELAAQIAEAEKTASAGGAGDAALAEEREQLEAAKRKAVGQEDFAEAGRLKKRLKLLEEQGGGCGSAEALGRQAWSRAAELVAAAAGAEEAKGIAQELRAAAPAGALPGAPAAAAAKPAAAKSSAMAHHGQAVKREAGAGAAAIKHEVKSEDTAAVKGEASTTCSVPGFSADQLLAMPNQDIWTKAWEVTWQRADAAGQGEDQQAVYAQAQKVWRSWLAERDQLARARADEEGRLKAERTLERGLAEAKEEADAGGAGCSDGGLLTEEQRRAQERNWRESKTAEADWKRAVAEAERRRKAKEGGEAKSSRDLCALVKLKSPADQPLQFERLLAVCPLGTTVKTLIQALAKEPQEFRQNFDGSEYCVRPVNSRCTDWLPVQASTTPPGFRDDATLPESMLNVAKQIFEERLRPQGQAAEDPLAQFLAQPGRIAPDTPLPFVELLSRCPPGTEPMELVRTMSKRRDVFRQDPSGGLFCVRPRAKCRDWGAVNPYVDPTGLPTSLTGSSKKEGGSGGGGPAATKMVPASQMSGDY